MYTALILCGGESQRSELKYNKVFHLFHEKPLVMYAVERFLSDQECDEIIVITRNEDLLRMSELVGTFANVFEGGKLRQDSARLGLEKVKSEYVLIHDGSRGYFTLNTLRRLKDQLKHHYSVSPGVPVIDTLKRVSENSVIGDVYREGLVHVQTPQAFVTSKILEAHRQEDGEVYSCDASLLKARLDIDTRIVKGDRMNIKFTTPDDEALLEMILK